MFSSWSRSVLSLRKSLYDVPTIRFFSLSPISLAVPKNGNHADPKTPDDMKSENNRRNSKKAYEALKLKMQENAEYAVEVREYRKSRYQKLKQRELQDHEFFVKRREKENARLREYQWNKPKDAQFVLLNRERLKAVHARAQAKRPIVPKDTIPSFSSGICSKVPDRQNGKLIGQSYLTTRWKRNAPVAYVIAP